MADAKKLRVISESLNGHSIEKSRNMNFRGPLERSKKG